MDKINYFKWNLSLRKSLVLYMLFFVLLALLLSTVTFSICNSAVNKITNSYPPSGEKYYLTNEQGQQLGNGVYIGTTPASLPKKESQTIALLELSLIHI